MSDVLGFIGHWLLVLFVVSAVSVAWAFIQLAFTCKERADISRFYHTRCVRHRGHSGLHRDALRGEWTS